MFFEQSNWYLVIMLCNCNLIIMSDHVESSLADSTCLGRSGFNELRSFAQANSGVEVKIGSVNVKV